MLLFQEYLDKILTKQLESLTKGEILFLRARISYLTPEQISKYKLLDIPNTEVPYATHKTNTRRARRSNK